MPNNMRIIRHLFSGDRMAELIGGKSRGSKEKENENLLVIKTAAYIRNDSEPILSPNGDWETVKEKWRQEFKAEKSEGKIDC